MSIHLMRSKDPTKLFSIVKCNNLFEELSRKNCNHEQLEVKALSYETIRNTKCL